jgi:hypothetical protein
VKVMGAGEEEGSQRNDDLDDLILGVGSLTKGRLSYGAGDRGA